MSCPHLFYPRVSCVFIPYVFIPRVITTLVLAILVLARRAEAAPIVPAPPELTSDRVTLTWRAPTDACPDEAVLRARIAGLIASAEVQLTADAHIVPPAPAEPRWGLDLKIDWARGHDERRLYAVDCSALADATVVLVAVLAAPLALTDNFVTTPSPPVFAPTPVAPAPLIATSPPQPVSVDADLEPATPTVRPATVRVAPRSLRRRGPFARVAAIAGYGVLPRVDVGVQIAAGALLPRLRLEGALTFLPPQAAELGDGSNRGAVPAFASASVRACPRLFGAPLELSLCGALEGGLSWGRSLGLTPQRRAAGPWLALALGPAVDWWFSPQVALHATVEAVAAPISTAYSLGDQPIAGGRHFGVRGAFGLTFALTQQKSGRPEK